MSVVSFIGIRGALTLESISYCVLLTLTEMLFFGATAALQLHDGFKQTFEIPNTFKDVKVRTVLKEN